MRFVTLTTSGYVDCPFHKWRLKPLLVLLVSFVELVISIIENGHQGTEEKSATNDVQRHSCPWRQDQTKSWEEITVYLRLVEDGKAAEAQEILYEHQQDLEGEDTGEGAVGEPEHGRVAHREDD